MSDALFTVPVQGLESDERFTPQWVFLGMRLKFDLDPASPVEGGDRVPARQKFTRLDDGLACPWRGMVWLNPPFSNATPWADRFRWHGNGVFLGPIANARWWVDLAAAADRLWLCRDFAFTHPTHAGRRFVDAPRLRRDGCGGNGGARASRPLRQARRRSGGACRVTFINVGGVVFAGCLVLYLKAVYDIWQRWGQ